MKTPCIIDISLQERLKAGSHTSTVPSKDKTQESVFKLKLKGEMPQLAEVKQDPSMTQKDEDGVAIISPEKKTKSKPCEIDASLQERINAGSITTQVPSAKQEEPEVF